MISTYLQQNPNPEVGPGSPKQEHSKYEFLWGLADDVIFALLGMAFAGRGKSLNKIIGHIPGRMNSVVEEAIHSDFRAGHSYFPRINLSENYLRLSTWIRRGTASALLGVSLFSGPTSWAQQDWGLNAAAESKLESLQKIAASQGISFKVTEGFRSQERQNYLYSIGRTIPGKKKTWTLKSRHTSHRAFDIAVLKNGKATWDPADYQKIGPLGESVGLIWGGRWRGKDLVHFEVSAASKYLSNQDYAKVMAVKSVSEKIARFSDTNIDIQRNVSSLLFETAVHESGRFRFSHQAGGPGVSYYSLVPDTIESLVAHANRQLMGKGHLAREMNILTTGTGYTATQLAKMSRNDLASAAQNNQVFAAAVARLRYANSPGKVPNTLESRAGYAANWYYRGPNKSKYKSQYISDNREIAEELKAFQLAKAVQKHIPPPKPTQGLVNKVLHENKVKHSIMSQVKKMVRHV